jgi:hypothetical protein
MAQAWFALGALPRQDGEEWRELPGHGGAYAVSSHGRVARLAPSTRTVPGQLLAGSTHKNGYRMLQLTGPRVTIPVHQLVWRAFRGDVPAGRRLAHQNGDLLDDRLENLVPVTYREQTERLFREGKLRPWPAGNPRARLTSEMHERILATKGTHKAGVIAAELGISIDAVHSIRQGRYSKHAKAAAPDPTGEATPKGS